VPYGYIESFLFDVAALGVHVKHAYDIREACVWLGVLHRWWSKRWSDHKGMRTLDSSHEPSLMPNMDEGMKQRVKIAAQLPAVGFERAVAVAQHFASVSDMINAGFEEWVEVPGIGKVIAKAVVAAIG
jgi:ERCC4-type nuclease